MRKLACYSLETQASDDSQRFDSIHAVVDEWIASKGELANNTNVFQMKRGRTAQLDVSRLDSSIGSLRRLVLTEPIPAGRFRTDVTIAQWGRRCTFSTVLLSGSDSLAPHRVDVHRPQIIRSVLDLSFEWTYQGSGLTTRPIAYCGQEGGDEFIRQIWNDERSIPIVVISTDSGLILHPEIDEEMANELAGLAAVATLDEEASWRLTEEKGKTWSCYGGAIRLYWPGITPETSPFEDHKLWTSFRLLHGTSDTAHAANRIVRQIRREVMSQSAFAIQQNPIISEIHRCSRRDEINSLRKKADSVSEYEAIIDKLETDYLQLDDDNAAKEEEIASLRARVDSLTESLRWRRGQAEVIEHATEAPPSTFEEAVLTAKEAYCDTLLFGNSLKEGIESVTRNAGPPDKVLRYLKGLHELTLAKRQGPLGTTNIKWLEARNIIGSKESDKVLNDDGEMAKRTWSYGDGYRDAFELHLKPKESTQPDQCVRIYFRYHEDLEKVIVGWAGRHP